MPDTEQVGAQQHTPDLREWDTLAAQIAKLRSVLSAGEKYADHAPGCSHQPGNNPPCDCGLSDWLAEYAAALAIEPAEPPSEPAHDDKPDLRQRTVDYIHMAADFSSDPQRIEAFHHAAEVLDDGWRRGIIDGYYQEPEGPSATPSDEMS